MEYPFEVKDKLVIYLDATHYITYKRDNLFFVIDRQSNYYLQQGEVIMFHRLWELSSLIYDKVDCLSHIEHSRFGESNVYVLTDNIKYGNIICKLKKRSNT